MGIWGSTVVPPYAHFFYKEMFVRPSLLFVCWEQPKSPPKAPGFASGAAAVLWQQYFNCHNHGQIERNWGTIARAQLQQCKQAWVVLGALLAAFGGWNSSWAEKIKFRKKIGGYPKTRLPGSFFYPKFFWTQKECGTQKLSTPKMFCNPNIF